MLSFRKINPSNKNAALRTEVAYCGACVLMTFLMNPEKQWCSSLRNSKGENGQRWRGAGYGPTLRLHHSSGHASLLSASSPFYDIKWNSLVVFLWVSEAVGDPHFVVSRNHNASWGVLFAVLGTQLRHLPTSPMATGTRREVTMPDLSHKNLPHEICHHPSHPGAKGRGLEALQSVWPWTTARIRASSANTLGRDEGETHFLSGQIWGQRVTVGILPQHTSPKFIHSLST